MIALNPTLHSWTIENLVKNAIDAMKGKGKLSVVIEDEPHLLKIRVSDTGKEFQKISSKKYLNPVLLQKTWLGFRIIFDQKDC
jgi:sensor histidine kinase regulating citrate/malate metabolism